MSLVKHVEIVVLFIKLLFKFSLFKGGALQTMSFQKSRQWNSSFILTTDLHSFTFSLHSAFSCIFK
ncbi:hypothetical protein DNTS_026544 [Danionella cerebrum]|uniref:Uncharacterized protein n=1 Tax=Danionella cerebrum TaxID=2873325 RepID=A0A553REY8_9TELE|nr:hypothetical protein DNTS_026544 [Danionella translucida]